MPRPDRFQLVSEYQPTGDQPKAIAGLVERLSRGDPHACLLGATGTGKTFTMANVIEKLGKPTLIISHNKTLAAQLYEELREFFPNNAVCYFVSYYDYYQPEAYIPQRDIYIEKDASRNDELDQLRLQATSNLLGRRDTIVVASVSCIFGLGSPEAYGQKVMSITRGTEIARREFFLGLNSMQYQRADVDFKRGTYRVRGDLIEVWPAYERYAVRIDLFGDEIERVELINPTSGELLAEERQVFLFPAVHYVMPEDRMQAAIDGIRSELDERVMELRSQGKLLEAQRLLARTKYDLEMIEEVGFCSGVENYSRYMDGREPGERPFTLMDYLDYAPPATNGAEAGATSQGGAGITNQGAGITNQGGAGILPASQGQDSNSGPQAHSPGQTHPGAPGRDRTAPTESPEGVPLRAAQDSRQPDGEGRAYGSSRTNLGDWLLIIDESHVTVPQIRAMYNGDRQRKQVLVEHGFRLPSALDNRPLRFEEFESLVPQVLYVSATPGQYELERVEGDVVEQVIRPTGLVDPEVEVRPAGTQVQDLMERCADRVAAGERVLVTALTKRLCEDLTRYLDSRGMKVRYLHSEIETLDRISILTDLRAGEFDVLVGVNLLREGLDLPEVSLVCILDADKEGFLRSGTSLIQQMGRAARNVNARVIMYADKITPAMREAMEETERRREKQLAYNEKHGITPATIKKAIRRGIELELRARRTAREAVASTEEDFDTTELLSMLEEEMLAAAEELDFEKAAQLRDQVQEIKKQLDLGGAPDRMRRSDAEAAAGGGKKARGKPGMAGTKARRKRKKKRG